MLTGRVLGAVLGQACGLGVALEIRIAMVMALPPVAEPSIGLFDGVFGWIAWTLIVAGAVAGACLMPRQKSSESSLTGDA